MSVSRIFLAALLATGFLHLQSHAAVILSEDFEDATVGYTLTDSNGALAEATDGAGDFIGRIGAGALSTGTFYEIGNIQGGSYFGAMDIDATPEPAANNGTAQLLWSGLNIAGETGLSFSGFFAEDDDGSNQDWDADTSVVVEAQIDSGGFFPIFAIESDIATGSNSAAFIDTNFDGLGDGAEITADLTEYSAAIAGTGNSLDLRITMSNLNAGDEDIAFDNISITSVTAIPEPSSMAALAILSCGFLVRRRKRS